MSQGSSAVTNDTLQNTFWMLLLESHTWFIGIQVLKTNTQIKTEMAQYAILKAEKIYWEEPFASLGGSYGF